jgi:REP element-mobilizing transposase RayT
MTLYKNKYRIESARCQNWDYTSNGYYFITICTQNREYFFGDVVADKMQLSPVGKIVAEEWQKTAQIRSYIELDEWAIVPNHLHGIIIIKNQPPPPLVETPRWGVSQQATFHPEETFQRNVSTTNTTKSRLKPKSLGSIIGQIKTACTKRIWEAGYDDFEWQDRFYDHIIQDDESLHNIRQYIINNPLKWELDKNNPANLYMYSNRQVG